MSKPLMKNWTAPDGTEFEVCDPVARKGIYENTDEAFFDIDDAGVVCLKEEYRGNPKDFKISNISSTQNDVSAKYPKAISDMGEGVNGSRMEELPEYIVIPETVNGIVVTGLAPGMFMYNNQVKEITLPNAVTEIPEAFCIRARYLRSVKNTQQVEIVGAFSFMATRIEKALFPKLKECAPNVFSQCVLLHSADIGEYITEIPMYFFNYCRRLHSIKGGAKVKTIGDRAFAFTMSLKELWFWRQLEEVRGYAFFDSRIQHNWEEIAGTCSFGTNATPVADNTTKYWEDVNLTSKANPLNSLFSQRNPAWQNETYGTSGKAYSQGCAVFSVLHIHSAITGKTYKNPKEFEEDIAKLKNGAALLAQRPGSANFEQNLLTALDYNVTSITGTITKSDYTTVKDAIVNGAYVLADMSAPGTIDGGHVVTIYGMSKNGEMLFVDSDSGSDFVDIYDDLFKYSLPLQNFTGPSSDLVIVKKK